MGKQRGVSEVHSIPFQCPVCRACQLDLVTGRCAHGGPYAGYVEVEDEQGISKRPDNRDGLR